MVQSLSLCLMGYEWLRQVALRSFSKWSLSCCTWRLKSLSAVAMYSSSESSASLSLSLLVETAIHWGCRFYPFLPPLAPFLELLIAILDGVLQMPTTAIFTLPRMKAAPTASSSEAC
jgi:hypothetical protein